MAGLHRLACLSLVSFFVSSLVSADELETLSLEELLQVELNVAARSSRTIRDSPGVLSLVTREEIVDSGARNLTDLLLRVPGLAFGVDVNGVVGIGVRGIWAHEGKALLLVDGQEMNENLYSSFQWSHHIPLDLVERIEIIRGPGSAIYGGYAELAVVNIITRSGSQLDGAHASVANGSTMKDYGHRSASLSYGKKLANGLDVSLSGSFSQGHHSDRRYEDFYGDSISMLDAAEAQSGFANFGLSWKGASIRYIYDDYAMKVADGFDAVTPIYDQTFTSHLAEAKYDATLGPVVLTPKVNYRRQVPWRTPQKADDAPFYDKTVERFSGGLSASWDALAGVNVLAGAEAYQDHAFLNDDELTGFQTQFANGKDEVTYQNLAGYAQVLWDNKIANLALGARVEDHSEYGSSFVPRAALTKVVDRFHFKLLYSSAFRAPSVENLRVSDGEVKPERTTVFEAESGYKIASGLFVTANVFDITIEDPIVYFYDDATGEDYVNYPRTGSRGAEVEIRAARGRLHSTLGLSIYDAAGKNEVPIYETGSDAALLGLPQVKVVANGGAALGEKLNLDLTAIVLGPRKGYLEGDGAGNSTVEDDDAILLADAFLRWRDVLTQRLELGIGVYNILDAEYRLLQPYAGGHAPLPTGRRQAFVRLSYSY
jgi:outer membrane cobalamin receptor